MDCYIHPGTASITTCEVCGRGVCSTCRARRQDREICFPCSVDEEPVETIKDRSPSPVEEPLAALGLPVSKGSTCGPLHYLFSILLGGGAALIIAFLWAKLAALLGHDTWYFAMFAGVGIAIAVLIPSGLRRGLLLPVIAAAMTALCITVHNAVRIQDAIMENPARARQWEQVPWALRLGPLMSASLAGMEARDWLFFSVAVLLAGIIGCATTFGSREEKAAADWLSEKGTNERGTDPGPD